VSDRQIETALRDIVLEQVSPIPVPAAPLSVQANPGALTATVGAMVGGTGFAPAQLLMFHDTTGERRTRIESVAGGTLTLDFSGRTTPGLAFTHTVGTIAYANLYTGLLIDPGPLLALGDPALCITVTIEDETLTAAPDWYEYGYQAIIRYMIRLAPPDGIGVQPDINAWALEQQDRAKDQMEAIAKAIRANQRLTTSTGSWAVSLGLPGAGQGQPAIRKDWQQLVANLDTFLFSAEMIVLVRAADS